MVRNLQLKQQIKKVVKYINKFLLSKQEIKKYDKEDFTSITFQQDLSTFKIDKLKEDTIELFIKRVYNLAGVKISQYIFK